MLRYLQILDVNPFYNNLLSVYASLFLSYCYFQNDKHSHSAILTTRMIIINWTLEHVVWLFHMIWRSCLWYVACLNILLWLVIWDKSAMCHIQGNHHKVPSLFSSATTMAHPKLFFQLNLWVKTADIQEQQSMWLSIVDDKSLLSCQTFKGF